METKTRILIADTNEEFRNLLSELIRDEGDMEVVGAVGDGIEALSKASEEKPDVLICDLVLSKLDGLEVLHRLPEASPGTKPIVVSGFINDMARRVFVNRRIAQIFGANFCVFCQ